MKLIIKINIALPLVLSVALLPSAARAEDTSEWQRLVGILQYLESDYPAAVASRDPGELTEQANFADEAVEAVHGLGPAGAPYEPRLAALRERIQRAQDPQGVQRDCAALVDELVRAGGLRRAPREMPDLGHAQELFQQNCAICHGADGSAHTELAKTLQPPPASFVRPEMAAMTPYKAFNALTLGVAGTGMPSFGALSEQDRWALAFYVLTLRQPPCTGKAPSLSLEVLANTPDEQLARTLTPAQIACARRKPPTVDEASSLLAARAGVHKAMGLAAAGDGDGARKALIDAYLTGVEPVEPKLRLKNDALVRRIEDAFGRARVQAERKDPKLGGEGQVLIALLDQAAHDQGTAQDFASVFWLSFGILLREGFEATVVIAALLAVLKKMRQQSSERIVHIGWVSALAMGAVAFVFGRHLMAGANQELLEGWASLLAVGMLLYAALWLNARSNIRKFMGELRHKMEGALGRGSAVGLFTISFTSVFREAFETAVFLQGLAADSMSGMLWGVAAGAVAMVALVVFVNRVGYRLPMKPLFNASTVLLVATAVVLMGKGVHALQEVGAVPLKPWGSFRIEALGVFPDAYSLVPQIVLAAGPLILWLVRRRTVPRAPAMGKPQPER